MRNFLRRIFGAKKEQANWRSFKAAIENRLTGAWTSTATPANYDIRVDYKVLIARVRDLIKNNDYVKRYLSMVRSNVIGPTGIVVQSRVASNSTPGKTDKPASAAVEAAWIDWGRFGSPDVTGRHSWVTLQNQFIGGVMSEGEVIFRKIRGWRGNKARFALQVMDVMDLPVDYNDSNRKNPIVMGIELNEWRAPVAYHFVQRSPTADSYTRDGRSYLRIPASQIIHAFLPEAVHQTRGISPMTSAMLRLNMLEGYEEAAVVSARIGASTMGFFTKTDEAGSFTGDDENVDGSLNMGVSPGEFRELPSGMDIATFDPKTPNDQYADFVKSTLRGISSGLGVSYNMLANDLSDVNFSSIRTGVLEDRELWKCLQNFTIDVLVHPVFEEFIDQAILAGAITIFGKEPTSGPERYKAAAYQGRRWSWVDPFKDAKTAELLINNRLTSRGNIIRDMGLDPDDVWSALSEEETLLESLGIPAVSSTNEVLVDENNQA